MRARRTEVFIRLRVGTHRAIAGTIRARRDHTLFARRSPDCATTAQIANPVRRRAAARAGHRAVPRRTIPPRRWAPLGENTVEPAADRQRTHWDASAAYRHGQNDKLRSVHAMGRALIRVCRAKRGVRAVILVYAERSSDQALAVQAARADPRQPRSSAARFRGGANRF